MHTEEILILEKEDLNFDGRQLYDEGKDATIYHVKGNYNPPHDIASGRELVERASIVLVKKKKGMQVLKNRFRDEIYENI